MHPRQANLLAEATEVMTRLAASVLWKYKDGEGREFYLEEKKVTVRSPYDGKSFSAKPERMSLSDVGQGLKQAAAALYEYTAPSGQNFWLPEKKTRVFSPWDGKSFSAKPDKDTISEITKDVKEDTVKKASMEPKARTKLLLAIYKRQPTGNKLLVKGKHKILLLGSGASDFGVAAHTSIVLEDASDEDLEKLAKVFSVKVASEDFWSAEG